MSGVEARPAAGTFLRNAWYCVGFPDDIEPGKSKALKVLNQALLLFRGGDGKVVALADRCPHRFAPLSRGRIEDGAVRCGYHGLKFDSSGRCVHNPHGNGALPQAANVRSYPMLERHQALWVWMGEQEKADPALLPDFSGTEERAGWARVRGYLKIRAHYQLVIDNLLDLTHVPFLHPFLASGAPPPPGFRRIVRAEQQGNTVLAINELPGIWLSPLYKMLWERGTPPVTCDIRANMRWDAPGSLYLDTGAAVVGGPTESGPTLLQGHWLTPETEHSTHYFWVVARDRYVADEAMGHRLADGIGTVFSTEDEPMIEAVQESMGTTDLWSLSPVMLSTDNAPVRARRILEKLLRDENASGSD